MIVEEILDERLVKHYSDAKKMMLQVETGVKYAEAIDVIPCRYTYEETDEDVPTYDEPIDGIEDIEEIKEGE